MNLVCYTMRATGVKMETLLEEGCYGCRISIPGQISEAPIEIIKTANYRTLCFLNSSLSRDFESRPCKRQGQLRPNRTRHIVEHKLVSHPTSHDLLLRLSLPFLDFYSSLLEDRQVSGNSCLYSCFYLMPCISRCPHHCV